MAIQQQTLKKYREDFEPLEGRPRSRYGPKEGWLTFILVLLLVLSVVWSVEIASWVKGLPSITLTALLGVLTGMILAKVKARSALLHLVALVLGYLLLVWQTRELTVSGGLFAKTEDLVSRFRIWVTAAESGGISADPLPFIIIIFTVAWIISYFSSWFVFRSLRLWPVLIPTALALFLNLLYLPEKFLFFFYLYILFALMLAMRVYFLRKQAQWHRDEIPYFKKADASFALIALFLGSAVVLGAWLLPRTDFSPTVMRKTWATLSTPWKSMETELGRVLSFLPAQKPYTIHKFGDAFPFRGASSLGDHVVMRISSNRPSYWKAETFDVYTPKGWLSGDRANLTDEFIPAGGIETYRATRTIDQVIELGVSSDALFAGGTPLYSTVGFDLEIAPPMTFTIDPDDPSLDNGLPEDLLPVAEAIRAEARKGALTFTDAGALQSLPDDTVVNEIVIEGNRVVEVVLSRLPPNPPDITSLRPKSELDPFDDYGAISFVSLASEEALRSAGTDYPSWVTDRYLQLPEDFPERIGNLSRGLTRIRDNPYDQAVAIQNWLRKIMFYSTDIEPPPQDADGVDYFVFTSKRGYSSYFSSSMTVMLRSIGVPARLAVGYSTGGWDDEAQTYVVRSSNAHSWPEVYFPRYGWIPFEPVPINDVFVRGGVIDEGESAGPEEALELLLAGDPPGHREDLSRSPSGGFWGGIPLWGFVLILTVPFSLLVLVVGFLRIWLSRGLSKLDLPSQIYGRMTRLASVGGFGPTPTHTPMEYGLALATEMDVVEGHVEQIVETYAETRYGSRSLSPEEKEALSDSWRSLRRTLLLWALKRRVRHWRFRR